VTRLPVAAGYGRIRTVQAADDGSLWFTTSNGTNDRIVRIRPTAAVPRVAAGSLVSSSGVTAARTGNELWVFVRSTGDAVYYRRSTDNGATWRPWTSAGVTSTDAPTVTASRAGRIDLFTRDAGRGVRHTWFVGGARSGSAAVGGTVIAQHASSVGDGTIDVWGVWPSGNGYRRHFDGRAWSAWTFTGGRFTSGLSATTSSRTRMTVLTGRGTDAFTYERTFTPTGSSGSWLKRNDGMSVWSSRALADLVDGQPRTAVALGPDGSLAVQRGGLVMGVASAGTASPDVVSRADGTVVAFGRAPDGTLSMYDARPGQYVTRSLGGVVR
jgi:hypothetical protein